MDYFGDLDSWALWSLSLNLVRCKKNFTSQKSFNWIQLPSQLDLPKKWKKEFPKLFCKSWWECRVVFRKCIRGIKVLIQTCKRSLANICFHRLAGAQWTAWSPTILEDLGSNPVFGKIDIEHCLLSTVYKNKNKEKEAGNGPFLIFFPQIACCTVDSVVAYDTRGPGFESSLRQI